MVVEVHAFGRGASSAFCGRFHRLHEACTLAAHPFPLRCIFFEVVVLRAVHVGLFSPRVDTQRMVVPQDDVRVFADGDGAHAVIDAQQFRRIQRHKFQRFFLGNASVLHGLGCLLVQTARHLSVV